MKKFKLIILMLLIISFLIILSFGIFGTSLSYLSSKEIKENRKLKKDLINNIKINNVETVYDKNNNVYYYMVPDDYENKNYVLKLELDNKFKYKIIGETLNIIKVDYSKSFTVIIYNDKYYYETKIQLTNLPLINIESEYDITTNDTESVFNYINSDTNEKVIINNSKIHIRGATSQSFNKKSYKINMYDKNYNREKEINISNFYYGNSFVLDAVYRDSSKIRNVLATELWNQVSNDFSDIIINSEFVELFINNEYIGLYVLTEPINRRSLNLNKSSENETSIVLKSSGWDVVTSDSDISSIENDIYMAYELKYPNDNSLYSKSWKKVLGKISKYYDSYMKSSYDVINDTFNIENYVDLIIFNAFVNNSDNKMKKNNYFYMTSLGADIVYIQPWDLEFTFGIKFSNTDEKNTSKNMDDYNVIYAEFVHENSPEINELLINRYWELRKDVLTKNYFDNLLNKYKNQLSKGAALRDSEIWYEYDIEEEIEEIRTWLYNRLDFFDEYVEGLQNEQS